MIITCSWKQLHSFASCFPLVTKRLYLVYGGGSIGLFVLKNFMFGFPCHRIIPRPLLGKEKTGETIGELRMVADMLLGKAEMVKYSDCFTRWFRHIVGAAAGGHNMGSTRHT